MSAALAFVAVTFLFVPQAQGERVPVSAVVDGVPQGIFIGRSLLTGRAVCLLFLSGGRITRAVPEGGLESFDWNRHRAAHSGDSGTWTMRGSQLVVTWGDGGVHQGPITANANGIEFYGKRYSKPVPVSIGAITGRWESARGTAITGGQGINRISQLVIQADGRYQWGSTTGGVVAGRAAAADRSMSGQVRVKGLTIVFTADSGRATSHTFLPAAGTPVSAFTVDTDMFTRVGPAPVSAATPAPAPPSSSSPGATNYQGLHFATPTGWASGMQQGRFMLTPSSGTPDTVVIVILSGAERLNGRSLGDWFAAKMAADLSGGLKALQTAPATRGRSGALETLSGGRTVQDQKGTVLLQIYHAISDGQQAGVAMVAAGSEGAMKTHIASVQGLFQSLRFDPAPGAPPSAPPVSAGRGSSKREITVGDLVGSWSDSSASHADYVSSGGSAGSNTIAYGDGYTFSAAGTFTYLFSGMVNSRFIKETDSGTWGFQGGNLVIRGKQRTEPVRNSVCEA